MHTKYANILGRKDNDIGSLFKFIKDYNKVDIDDRDNITVVKGKAPYDCFVCHLDTVHKGPPEIVVIADRYLISTNGNGVGGDDKCGIMACLELLNSLKNVKVVFFTEEETGAKGSRAFDVEFFKDCKYVIEIDRRGNNNFIQQSGFVKLCTDEFATEWCKETYFDTKEKGTFTDVNVLKDKVALCMANLSAGYFNAHTAKEYIDLKALRKTIEYCNKFAQRNNNKIWTFEPEPVKTMFGYTCGGYKAFDDQDDYLSWEQNWRGTVK
jgi:di/tripeptidase